MRRLFLLFCTFIITASGISQNTNNDKSIERIKRNDACYWAESGFCNDANAAEIVSLVNLVKNIKDNCKFNIAYYSIDSYSRADQTEKVFATFADTIKAVSKKIVIGNDEGEVNIFRYINKESFAELCDAREDMAYLYYKKGKNVDVIDKENGKKNIGEISIGDALRYYCWSLKLCYSHPYGATFKVGDDEDMCTWLYNRINTILDRIDVNLVKEPVLKDRLGVAYKLVVTDGEYKIPWLRFEYNNGDSIVEGTVGSGLATVELVKKNIRKFDFNVCVENRDEAKGTSKNLYNVLNQFDIPLKFASAVKSCDIKQSKDEDEVEKDTQYKDSIVVARKQTTVEFIEEWSVENSAKYENVMKKIEKAFRNRDIDDARNCFTAECFQDVRRLLNSGRYYILGTPEYKFLNYKNTVICRSIPISFNFGGGNQFVKNVVFRFDKDTVKVSSIAFRLEELAEIDIMGKGQWDATARMVLVNFLEDYQTAYALKKLDYIEKIFSEDALIVVGTVLKQKKKTDDFVMNQATKVKYDTLSKSKFIDNLGKVFAKNEFVSIRFYETKFTRHGRSPEVYGIRVKQEYRSSTYGDEGYLFLIVDLGGKLPVIHVRTWEPDKTDKPIDFNNFVSK